MTKKLETICTSSYGDTPSLVQAVLLHWRYVYSDNTEIISNRRSVINYSCFASRVFSLWCSLLCSVWAWNNLPDYLINPALFTEFFERHLGPNSTTRTPATDMLYNTTNRHHQRTSSRQFYNKFATSQCQSPTSRHVKMFGCGKFLSVGGEFVVQQVVHCVPKNDTDVTHCRFNPHQPISIIFGRDVAERVCYWLLNGDLLSHLS